VVGALVRQRSGDGEAGKQDACDESDGEYHVVGYGALIPRVELNIVEFDVVDLISRLDRVRCDGSGLLCVEVRSGSRRFDQFDRESRKRG